MITSLVENADALMTSLGYVCGPLQLIHDPSESVFTHTWKASIRSSQFCSPFSLMLQNMATLAFRVLSVQRAIAFRELA